MTGKQRKQGAKKQLNYKSWNNIQIQGMGNVKCFVASVINGDTGIVAGGLKLF